MSRKMLYMLLLAAVLLPSCLDDIEEVPLEVEDDLMAPVSISTVIGDGQIALSWESVAEASSYRLYRSATLGETWVRIAETADTSHVDESVSNGVQYLYSVSSVGASGIESSRSEAVSATPSVYSLLINGGLEYTGSTIVELTLTAPATTSVMRISNVSDLGSAVWETYTPSRTWMVPEGDGPKTVYASFQDASGAVSPQVSASIELDTYAGIDGLAITPEPHTYGIGASVHLALSVE